MRHAIILSLAALVGLGSAAHAVARPLVRMDVVDRDSGRWLEQYPHGRDNWVAGQPGHRYAVRLTNTTGERVLVVLSVDGINAVTGQTAAPGQTGYVLAPWQSAEIAGWRKSHHEVAQFVFTALPDSYAARTGRPDHVGVIGIAVFRERQPAATPSPPVAREAARVESRTAESAAAWPAPSAPVQQHLGTGHGQRQWSPAGQTRFDRAGHPAQFTRLRYDAPGALAARGILPRARPWHDRARPQAFPGGFVADPPPRRR